MNIRKPTDFIISWIRRRRWLVDVSSGVLFLSPSVLFATNQIPDRIRIDDQVFEVCMSPILTQYFDEHPDQDPTNLPPARPDQRQPSNLDDTSGVFEEIIFISSLVRGYIATFAIEDGHLIVEQMEHRNGQPVIDRAMPDIEDRQLEWFSGPLFYLQIDPVDDNIAAQTKYSLKQIDIDEGRYVDTIELRTETHGRTSGISCSAGWGWDAADGPMTNGWCAVESMTSTTCIDDQSNLQK